MLNPQSDEYFLENTPHCLDIIIKDLRFNNFSI